MKYFVTYSHSTGSQFGYGNTEVTTTKKINTLKDIREVEKVIIELYPSCGNVVVLNYRKLKG